MCNSRQDSVHECNLRGCYVLPHRPPCSSASFQIESTGCAPAVARRSPGHALSRQPAAASAAQRRSPWPSQRWHSSSRAAARCRRAGTSSPGPAARIAPVAQAPLHRASSSQRVRICRRALGVDVQFGRQGLTWRGAFELRHGVYTAPARRHKRMGAKYAAGRASSGEQRGEGRDLCQAERRM